MDHQSWLDRWIEGRIGFHEEAVTPGLKAHWSKLKLPTQSTVFVPLCGKSKDMHYFASLGHRVVGSELSDIACKAFFEELGMIPVYTQTSRYTRYEHGAITLYCGDLFALEANDLPNIDAIYDCKALIALPPEFRETYLKKLIQLSSGAKPTLLITMHSEGGPVGAPYPIHEKEVEALFARHYEVLIVQSEPLDNIPAHLLVQGYQRMCQQVFCLNPCA